MDRLGPALCKQCPAAPTRQLCWSKIHDPAALAHSNTQYNRATALDATMHNRARDITEPCMRQLEESTSCTTCSDARTASTPKAPMQCRYHVLYGQPDKQTRAVSPRCSSPTLSHCCNPKRQDKGDNSKAPGQPRTAALWQVKYLQTQGDTLDCA